MTDLGTSSGVLRRASGDQFSIVVTQKVLIQAHMLVPGQDCVIGLQPVFLEQFCIAGSSSRQFRPLCCEIRGQRILLCGVYVPYCLDVWCCRYGLAIALRDGT